MFRSPDWTAKAKVNLGSYNLILAKMCVCRSSSYRLTEYSLVTSWEHSNISGHLRFFHLTLWHYIPPLLCTRGQAFFLKTYTGTQLESVCWPCAMRPPGDFCGDCGFTELGRIPPSSMGGVHDGGDASNRSTNYTMPSASEIAPGCENCFVSTCATRTPRCHGPPPRNSTERDS